MDDLIELLQREVDRTPLRENLKLTPEQRALELMALLEAAEEFQRAGRVWRDSRGEALRRCCSLYRSNTIRRGDRMSKRQELIDGLNEDLNLELEAVLRHVYHISTATGLLGHELRELLKGSVEGELEHAQYLADKITAMGGDIKMNVGMPKRVKSAKEMLSIEVAAERKGILNYTMRIAQAEESGERGLAIRLETMLSDETDHAEELERLGR